MQSDTEQLNSYASNPRYSPEGLESEIDNEALMEARKVDTQQAAMAELETPKPTITPDMTNVPSMDPEANKIEDESLEIKKDQKASLEKDNMIQMHEKILGVVDTATRIPRDVAGGLQKATDNTLAFIAGRENLDAGNEFVSENFPGLTKFTTDYEKGIAPEGTASEVTQELTQFFGPFGVYMKGLGILNAASKGTPIMGTFTKALTADVIASGTALDPHMERLSSLAKSMGVENQVVGWMADNENETESEGRLKNVLEASGLGLGLQAVLAPAFMTMKAMYRGSKALVPKPKKELPEIELDENAPGFGIPEKRTLEEGDELLTQTKEMNTPERIQFRDEAVKTFTSEAVPSKNPTVTFMGGGGASGKGTVSKLKTTKSFVGKDAVTIDPDSIKKAIPEYKKIIDAGDDRAAAMVHEESSDISKRVASEVIKKRANAVYDITLGNVESSLKKIKEFKDAGYKVNLVGVTIDVGEAATRAVKRALAENRTVPVDQLIKAHKGFSKGFGEYAKMVDKGVLYDNSGSTPKIIAYIENGAIVRMDDKAYTTFSRKGDINEKAKTIKELRNPSVAKTPAKKPKREGNDESSKGTGRRDENELDKVEKQIKALLQEAEML